MKRVTRNDFNEKPPKAVGRTRGRSSDEQHA
jgi:hypothetical protein